jgi:hypothetical protein
MDQQSEIYRVFITFFLFFVERYVMTLLISLSYCEYLRFHQVPSPTSLSITPSLFQHGSPSAIAIISTIQYQYCFNNILIAFVSVP